MTTHTLNSILVLATALLAVFWAAAFNGIRHLLGAQVDLLPALMVYAALSHRMTTVTLLAVTGGLLFDALSANPPGVSVLPLFVIGCFIHSRREVILRNEPFAQFILGLGASAAAPVLTVLILLTEGQQPLLGWGSLWQWFVMTLGGGIAAPVLFQLFALVDRAFCYRPATQTSFRQDREIRRGRF